MRPRLTWKTAAESWKGARTSKAYLPTVFWGMVTSRVIRRGATVDTLPLPSFLTSHDGVMLCKSGAEMKSVPVIFVQ